MRDETADLPAGPVPEAARADLRRASGSSEDVAAAIASSAAASDAATSEASACGAPAAPSANDEAALTAAIEKDTQAWWPRRSALLARMADDPDPRTRGAALYVQAGIGSVMAGLPLCQGAPDACTPQRGMIAEAPAARDALVALALATRDPLVYGWAVSLCGTVDQAVAAGPCAMVSAAEWARLDGDNGAVWQQVALEAGARKDLQARDDALYRMSKAPRHVLAYGQLGATLIRKAPPGTTPYQRYQLSVEAIGVEAALLIPRYEPLIGWCKPPLDANRRQVCDDLAHLLLERSTTLIDHAMGTALAQRLGWPAERVQQLRRVRQAYSEAMAPAVERGPWDCAGVERTLQHLQDVAQHGELGHARRLLASTGMTPEQAAAANQARLDKAAQAAASAASR